MFHWTINKKGDTFLNCECLNLRSCTTASFKHTLFLITSTTYQTLITKSFCQQIIRHHVLTNMIDHDGVCTQHQSQSYLNLIAAHIVFAIVQICPWSVTIYIYCHNCILLSWRTWIYEFMMEDLNVLLPEHLKYSI